MRAKRTALMAGLSFYFLILIVPSICRAGPDSAAPNVWLYDMGTETSPVWAGFSQVTKATLYDPQRGCGWVNPDSTISGYVADKLDALSIDCVNCRNDTTLVFRQDVPNGDYVVWVLEGSHLSIGYLLRPHALLLQGKVVMDIQPTEDEIFRAVRYDWSKGDDMYEQFITPRFPWRRAEAAVTDGKLEIGFKNSVDFPVCAVVIAKKEAADRVAWEIKRLENQRKEYFSRIWHGVPVKPGNCLEIASPEERRRGYIVAVVNYLEDVFPGSAPAAGAGRSAIEIFATQGEQEQASFGVFALADLRQVTYDVTDLKSAEGKVIPASQITQGLMQFAPISPKEGTYAIVPTMILPKRPTFIGKDTCKQFWLTAHVPEDAAAGVYEGTISILSVDAPPAELKFRLRVLPFKLAIPPVERFFYFGTMIYHAKYLLPAYDEKKYWESVRAETRYLKENEFCIAQCLANTDGVPIKWKDGKKGTEIVDVDLAPTYKLMEIVKEEKAWPRDNTMVSMIEERLNAECGGHWIQGDHGERDVKFCPTPEDRANFIRGVKIIEEKAKKAGWPIIAHEVGGELENYRQQGAEFGVVAYTALKEAGVKSALRGNGPADMVAIAKGLVPYPEPNWCLMQKQYFPIIKKNAERVWAYNFSTDRFGFGWFCFKNNITRASSEGGIYFHGQPGTIFAEPYIDFPCGGLPLSLTTFAPSVRLKRIVEGADDYKYLYTLSGLIREAGASSNAEAKKAAGIAQTDLDKLLQSVPDHMTAAFFGNAEWYGEVSAGISWYAGDFDKYRWQLARHIMAIQKTLGR